MSSTGAQEEGHERWTAADVHAAVKEKTEAETAEQDSLMDAIFDHPSWWETVPKYVHIVARLKRKIKGEESTNRPSLACLKPQNRFWVFSCLSTYWCSMNIKNAQNFCHQSE
jgi:hypothetical protein